MNVTFKVRYIDDINRSCDSFFIFKLITKMIILNQYI